MIYGKLIIIFFILNQNRLIRTDIEAIYMSFGDNQYLQKILLCSNTQKLNHENKYNFSVFADYWKNSSSVFIELLYWFIGTNKCN